ncbi:transmembrane 6 superfamily member 2 [Alligator mississippiensis]|uniref:transmembrane 6 superfamily member 2 n=1 Tax=Alligator mississippiensis TaxID=8496 RepID=UPI0028774E82|nr:transmembrane 6 superfamily member 2 [Alligator mississippiensis]
MRLPPGAPALALSALALPLAAVLDGAAGPAGPAALAVTGVLVLLAVLCVVFVLGGGSASHDPLYYVFTMFSFTSVIDLIISLEQDGYIQGYMEFYLTEGEPYLRTAYGIMICYWDGVIHYLLYLAMVAAIDQRKSYRSLGLYWLGSIMMSIIVFLPGNLIGKYSSEIRPAFLLNLPYLLLPIWAGQRLFQQPKPLPCCTADKVAEEQRKGLHQRPLDLGLILLLLMAGAFTLFRGLVVLDCPSESCFNYMYQYEPYLRDPVAYPKVQMLVYTFYFLPYFGLCIYGLVWPGCTWMPDWALVFAGATAQAQFSHVGASLHQRTPYPYRTPEEAWWSVVLANSLYALGPHLLAYRCLRSPGFFQPPVPGPLPTDKKRQ